MYTNRNVRKPKEEAPRRVIRETYDGKELRPFEGRSGALDAYKLPSIRGGKAVLPSMYMSRGEE
jgi:hypothetical protein